MAMHQARDTRVLSFMHVAQDKGLTRLIHRLEAATSRLEDIASSAEGPAPHSAIAGPSSRSIAGAASAAPSINGDVTPTQGPAPKLAIPEPVVDLPQVVEDFDTMMNEDLKPFKEISEKIGGVVAEQVGHIWAWKTFES
jgi:adenylyl cyclase-associated protein